MAAFIGKHISVVLYKMPSSVFTRGCSRNLVALYFKHISSGHPLHVADTSLHRRLGGVSLRDAGSVAHYLSLSRSRCQSRGIETVVRGGEQQDCWKCGKTINVYNEQYFCASCGVALLAVRPMGLRVSRPRSLCA